MNHPVDPHSLVPLSQVLSDNNIAPLDYLRLYIEDEVPPVVLFDRELFVVRSDLHLWKERLRTASWDHKAKLVARPRL